jgi:tetratricopeptide (TPR) repeat protein
MLVPRLVAATLVMACVCPAVADDAAPPAAEGAAALDAAIVKSNEMTSNADYSGALDVIKSVETKYGPSSRAEEQAARIFLAHATAEAESGEDVNLVRALFADAMTRAQKAVALDPDSGSATIVLSQGLRGYGDLDGARAALVGWIEKHPAGVGVRWEWAKWNFESRQWAEADRQFAKILETAPTDGRARLCGTIAKAQLNAPIDVLEKGYLDAARLLPEENEPLQRLADLHPKDRDKKLELLAKVVADNPKAAWARVWIAYVLRKEAPRDEKQALATLRDAEKIAPSNAAVHQHLAETLEETGAASDAVTEYTLAVENSAAGNAAGASAALDRLLHFAPGAADVPLAARERAYDALVAKNPESGSYGNNAGLWFRDLGKDYAKSIKYYLAAVKAQPDDQDYLNDAALIYLFHLTDRREECLPMFEKVVRLVEKDGAKPARGYWDALENLCKYWFEKGDYKKVVAFADKRANPDATVNGRPYPSRAAAQWKERALKALEGSTK